MSSLPKDNNESTKSPALETAVAKGDESKSNIVDDAVDVSASENNGTATKDDDEEEEANKMLLDENGKPLSKSQIKKRQRWARKLEVKKRRKQQEKEIKRAKAKAQGRDLEQEKIELKKRTEEGVNRKKRQQEWEEKFLPLAKKSWQVCIDCSFADQMMTKEINSLSSQIRYCYANNKRSPHPCLLTISSLSGNTLVNLKNVSGFDDWTLRAFSISEKPLNEVFKDRLKDIVYLTSDSENEVEDLDDSKIYIIGGIVDRNRLKRAAISRAEEFGVATARLPLEKHLQKMETTRVLTTNHVFEILLKYRELGKDWEKALLEVLPPRKGFVPISDKKSREEGEEDSGGKD